MRTRLNNLMNKNMKLMESCLDESKMPAYEFGIKLQSATQIVDGFSTKEAKEEKRQAVVFFRQLKDGRELLENEQKITQEYHKCY